MGVRISHRDSVCARVGQRIEQPPPRAPAGPRPPAPARTPAGSAARRRS
ncbi:MULTISPECIES: hypothetical protein [unclassified Crossiella]|nr:MULTISPECIES: hypothetical protein [unclassified Crossiella]MCK2242677.1 hypothetical protein [Crossiella sp. S99.2]MCK2256554.1 hypothetical protein [Crossiella sp. S99.1]